MQAQSRRPEPGPEPRAEWWAEWRWGLPLVLLATLLRVGWVIAVPTVPVGDFATYRESANFLVEFGSLDPGFIYMPGFVLMLAGVRMLGGELLAQKLLGVFFGALAAAAIFAITARLCDDPASETRPDGVRRRCPCPTAVVATLLYAVWPCGVAMSSVVGTDVPAAALVMAALAMLTRRTEPRRAALGFGIVMGLAAYVRAVALPLTLLSAFYWATRLPGRASARADGARPARRVRGWRGVAGLTALAVSATLIVLLPWALRNRARHGELFFTDCHGGITALIGANPNSEGTYTRALNRMFQDLTGKTVLDEPHRETDRAAYALAKDWTRFEPRYAAGLAVLRAGRLFAPEHNLLYWPIGRPGVLVGPKAAWFQLRLGELNVLTDRFWWALVALYAGGLALAVVDRRAGLLALVPFQLALAATYIVFFAEPRYRIPIEMMAFPVVALALRRLWGVAGDVARVVMVSGSARERGAAAGRTLRGAALPLAAAVAAPAILFAGAPLLLDAGARLRADHRWAATVASADGRAILAKWKRRSPGPGASPVAGAPNGVRLTVVGPGTAAADVEVATLPAGRYELRARLEPAEIAAGAALTFTLADDAGRDVATATFVPPGGPGGAVSVSGTVVHAGGPMRLGARLAAQGPVAADPSVWLSGFELRRLER